MHVVREGWYWCFAISKSKTRCRNDESRSEAPPKWSADRRKGRKRLKEQSDTLLKEMCCICVFSVIAWKAHTVQWWAWVENTLHGSPAYWVLDNGLAPILASRMESIAYRRQSMLGEELLPLYVISNWGPWHLQCSLTFKKRAAARCQGSWSYSSVIWIAPVHLERILLAPEILSHSAGGPNPHTHARYDS